MEENISTFENLVSTLSQDEIKKMLAKISSSMQTVQVAETSSPLENEKKEEEKGNPVVCALEKESLFLKLWFKLLSLIKSLPVEVLYQKELIRRIGSSLKDDEYIDVSKQLYTNAFYEALLKLNKTKMFFSSVLDCYNAEKDSFYMMLSSFIAPHLYEKLMEVSSHFENSEDASPARRSALLKEVERLSTDLDVNIKEEMYKTSQAIEWMCTFCDFSLDKVLLKFSVQPSSTTCSILTIQNEIELLASILASSKSIPISMLQTLFLLQQKDAVLSSLHSVEAKNEADIEKNALQFVESATHSISFIEEFKKSVPLRKIVKFTKQDITWTPIEFRAGEDWFLYFKHAWKDFFLQRWAEWVKNMQKVNITKKMLEITGSTALQAIKYKPWASLLGSAPLKNEFLLEFFKTFFATTYSRKIEATLKIITAEGNFYRTDTLSAFSSSYMILSQVEKDIETFENGLSPESVIGASFSSIIQGGVLTIKTKSQMESLVKNIESDIKRMVLKILESIKTMHHILSSIVGEDAGHAVLTNFSSIQGNQNKKFQEDVASVCSLLSGIIEVADQMGTLFSLKD